MPAAMAAASLVTSELIPQACRHIPRIAKIAAVECRVERTEVGFVEQVAHIDRQRHAWVELVPGHQVGNGIGVLAGGDGLAELPGRGGKMHAALPVGAAAHGQAAPAARQAIRARGQLAAQFEVDAARPGALDGQVGRLVEAAGHHLAWIAFGQVVLARFEQGHGGHCAPFEPVALPARLITFACARREAGASTVAYALRLEDAGVAGVQRLPRRDVIDHARIRGDFAAGAVLGQLIGPVRLHIIEGVMVAVVAGARTHDHGQVVGRFQARGKVGAVLADIGVVVEQPFRRRRLGRVAAPRIKIDCAAFDVGDVGRAAVVELGIVKAGNHFVAAAEQLERSLHLHIDAFLALPAQPRAAEQHHARARRAVGKAPAGRGLLAGALAVQMVERQFDQPVRRQPVFERAKRIERILLAAAPAGRRLGGRRQVRFHDAVDQLFFLRIVVDEAVALLRGGRAGLEGRRGTLAHQVDGARRFAGAGHQAGRAAQHVDVIVQRHVARALRGGGGGDHQRGGHAVELVAVDAVAAREDRKPFAVDMLDIDARRLFQHAGDRVEVLVVHALARDHADALRRFAQRQRQLGRRAAGAQRVGAAALAQVARVLGLDSDERQHAHRCGAAVCRNRSARLVQHVAAVAGDRLQAGAGQQAGKTGRDRMLALQTRRIAAGGDAGGEGRKGHHGLYGWWKGLAWNLPPVGRTRWKNMHTFLKYFSGRANADPIARQPPHAHRQRTRQHGQRLVRVPYREGARYAHGGNCRVAAEVAGPVAVQFRQQPGQRPVVHHDAAVAPQGGRVVGGLYRAGHDCIEIEALSCAHQQRPVLLSWQAHRHCVFEHHHLGAVLVTPHGEAGAQRFDGAVSGFHHERTVIDWRARLAPVRGFDQDFAGAQQHRALVRAEAHVDRAGGRRAMAQCRARRSTRRSRARRRTPAAPARAAPGAGPGAALAVPACRCAEESCGAGRARMPGAARRAGGRDDPGAIAAMPRGRWPWPDPSTAACTTPRPACAAPGRRGPQRPSRRRQVAVVERAGHVVVDGAQRHAQLCGDLGIRQSLQLRQQKRLPHGRFHAVENGVNRGQRFKDQGARFGRGRVLLGQRGQRFQIGALEALAAEEVGHQPARDRAQVGARRLHVGWFALAQDAQERVVRQVGSVAAVAELAAQPLLQPAVVRPVQVADVRLRQGGLWQAGRGEAEIGRWHGSKGPVSAWRPIAVNIGTRIILNCSEVGARAQSPRANCRSVRGDCPLLRQQPAIDRVVRCRHERRLVRTEPHDQRRHLVRFAETAERVLGHQRRAGLVRHAPHGWRVDVAGAHGIDADAARGIFQRRSLGQSHHAVLGGDIGAVLARGHLAQDGRHVDDGAAACGQHGWQLVAHAVEHAGQVDADDLVPVFNRVLADVGRRRAHARVVAGDVQRAVVLDGGGHERFVVSGQRHDGMGIAAIPVWHRTQTHPLVAPASRAGHGRHVGKDGHQLVQVHRFDQVVVEAGGGGLGAVGFLAVAGDGDQHGAGGAGPRTQALGHVVAVDIGQADIEQEHVLSIELGMGQCAAGIVLDDHLVALQVQQQAEHGGSVDIVVHQHDAQGGAGARERGRIGSLVGAGRVIGKLARQAHGKRAAMADAGAVAVDRTLVQRDQAFDQRQAQAQPAQRPVGRALGLGKQVERALDHVGRHADAVVRYPDQHVRVAHLDGHRHLAVLGRVLRGVAQQVRQYLHQAFLVAHDQRRVGRQLETELVAARAHQRRHLLDGVVDEVAHVQALGMQLHQAARDARDIEQIVHQRGHVHHLAADDLAGLADAGVVQPGHLQQVGGGADRRQRVAQLVRQHRQELVLALVRVGQLFLGGAALGHVAEEEGDAAVERAVGADLDPHAGAVGEHVGNLDDFGAARGHHAAINGFRFGALQFGPDVPVVASDQVGSGALGDAHAFGIHAHDGPVPVEHGKALGHAVENILALVAFGAQRGLRLRRFDGRPRAFRDFAHQADFAVAPRARRGALDAQHHLQLAGAHQRHQHFGADHDRCVDRAAAGRAGIGGHVMVDRLVTGAQRGEDLGRYAVERLGVAGQARDAGRGPVAADCHRAAVFVHLGVQHARGVQALPEQGAGGGTDVVRVAQLAQAVGQVELECLADARVLQLLEFFLQRQVGLVRGRHIDALHEDARDALLLADDGLVQQVHVPVFGLAAGQALQRDLAVADHHRFARRKSGVHQRIDALSGQFGQRLRGRLADDVAVAHQLIKRVVGHLERMVGAGEHGNEAGRLVEHDLQLAALGRQDAGHRFVHLRPVKLRHVGHGVGVLLQVVFSGGPVKTVQLGHVDGVLRDERDVACRIEHGGVDGAPVALVEHHALRGLHRHGIAQQRAGMGLAGGNGQLDRAPHFVQVGRIGIGRVGGKGVEDMLADQVVLGAAGGPQVGGVGPYQDKAGADLEHADRFGQARRLLLQGVCRSRRFFHQRGILLRHAVHLANGRADLGDALGLLLAGHGDFGDDGRHALDAGHHVAHGGAGHAGELAARRNLPHRVVDQFFDFLRGRGRTLGQVAHLRGHHRETAPLFAGARRFHGRIERQDIGLERDAVDHCDDVDDFAGRIADGAHGGDHFFHRLAALERDRRSVAGQLAGLAGVVVVLLDGAGELDHGRRGFFQRAGLLLGAGRQVEVAAGNFRGRRVDRLGAVAHPAHDVGQIVLHQAQRPQQVADLVARGGRHFGAQVARGHGLGHAHGRIQRRRDAADQPQHGDRTDCQHQDQRYRNGQRGLAVGGRVVRLDARGQVLRLLADVGHDVVDLAGGLAVHALDQRIDHAGAGGLGGIELRQRFQIAPGQGFLGAERVRHQRGADAEFAEQDVEPRQFGARAVAALDEGGAVPGKGFGIVAAHQDVFPFLHLDLEFHLRAACSVDGLAHGDQARHGGAGAACKNPVPPQASTDLDHVPGRTPGAAVSGSDSFERNAEDGGDGAMYICAADRAVLTRIRCGCASPSAELGFRPVPVRARTAPCAAARSWSDGSRSRPGGNGGWCRHRSRPCRPPARCPPPVPAIMPGPGRRDTPGATDDRAWRAGPPACPPHRGYRR
uniref:Uncharacterized protein n=1 Tax=Tanacetum cinerariifolium TaxID=118510 RepID=A0A699GES2_TANCI|nr:hypothetical protein [Tanacetum cinerariifolium]